MTRETTTLPQEAASREIESITSAKNPKIKALLALQEKSSLRRELGLFVVEGRRELDRCLRAGFAPHSVFACPSIAAGAEMSPTLPIGTGQTTPVTMSGDRGKRVPRPAAGTVAMGAGRTSSRATEGRTIGAATSGGGMDKGLGTGWREAARRLGCPVFEVSEEVYRKVAYRDSTEGVIAEVKAKNLSLKDITLRDNPLVIVLEAVEKPGNLGAVLRSADAAGADAVIICDPLTDLFNPNLIRASMGAAFTVQTAATTSEEAIRWLKDKKIRIYTAQLQDSTPYYSADMRGATAIVMGTEATGLTTQWRQAADAHIRIPMLGVCDSLNVSVSTAILLYEAVRQRRDPHDGRADQGGR